MSKYKYYFRKPKSELVKDIFKGLAISGAICIAATSPYFAVNLLRGIQYGRKYKKKNLYDFFYRFEKEGLIKIEKNNHQVRISLTQEGKKKAGWLQIDSLKINKNQKWDGKWRVIIFDIVQFKKLQRDIFRGKLKDLGLHALQKSVWVCPYKCKDEIELLRDFFGLSKNEIRIITAENIEDDSYLKKHFHIR